MIESGDNGSGDYLYRFDDVTVDGENFRVQKDGQNVALTPRAFDVLIFLLQNGGRVVEKQELFDRVWKDTFVSDNALTKIVKEIRHALVDDAGAPRYIETVPKRGYRFIAEMKGGNASEESAVIADAKGKSESATNKISAAEESNKAVPQSKTVSPTARRKFLFVGTVALILLAAASFFLFNKSRSDSTTDAPIDSIAVLPFENAAQDANVEYLADGVSENIINTLSRLRGLRVLPRSTVFRYKNAPDAPQTIGRMLGVRAVLTGKVVLRDDILTIQIDLIDVDREAQIWGQQYNRSLADVINLQEEIARTTVDRLSLRLTGAQQQQLSARDTDNSEAYQLYLKGNHFAAKRSPADLNKAIEYYREAIAKDSNYALAYAGLSEAYALTARPDNEASLRSKEAALEAIRLNPNSPETNTALAYILYRYDWNWTEAGRLFQRAIEANPNNAAARMRYGEMLTNQARHGDALEQLRLAVELEPLSLVINRVYGTSLLYAGRADEAVAQYQKTVELDTNLSASRNALGNAYETKGMYREAVAEYIKARELSGDGKAAQMLRAGFAEGGWRGNLQASLKLLQERAKTDYTPAFNIASLYAKLGEKEKAFVWLDKSYQARESGLTRLKVALEFQNLRDDSRFQNLLQRIGLE